jgi:hypothetical protein
MASAGTPGCGLKFDALRMDNRILVCRRSPAKLISRKTPIEASLSHPTAATIDGRFAWNAD